MDGVSSLTVDLPAGAGVPEWVHLLPAGTFFDTSGSKFHLRDPESVIAETAKLGKRPLDENHSTQRAPENGVGSPARGWIIETQMRENGIWGRVDWNASGIALMTDRAYKHISPVYNYDKQGNVTRILSAALTNNPGLPQLTALQTSEGRMDKVAICTALGIAGTVSDDEILSAAQTAASAKTALETAQAELARVKGELVALQTSSVPLARMTELETKLVTLQTDTAKRVSTEYVDSQIRAGKPISATRDEYIALHTSDPAQAEKMIAALPSIHDPKNGGVASQAGRKAMQDDDGLSEEDMAICTKMGVEPKEFAKQKKMRAGERSAA
jgi:phage I-like protein